ncbi:MAG TPA: four helix bundle protein [Thermoanaerobaculia bacterium]|nr:four helix bundle protein [Thermoanaerobaculia bacterium]
MPVETLQAWQLAMKLVPKIYRLTARFPSCERFGLAAQMRNAAVSIPSNLAEGHARHTRREFARFVSHAQGSTAELRTQLLIALELSYAEFDAAMDDELDHLARCLNRLRTSLLQSPRISNPESRIS